SLWYAFNENFVLPLSHDEVVHGKGSLIGRMPGDDWQKFANLRVLYGYMWTHPGKKLLFMGGEFGQRREWAHDGELDWPLAALPAHDGLRRWVADLNRVCRAKPALHQLDFSADGFQWIDCSDALHSVIAFLRRPRGGGPAILVACNFTPVPRTDYVLGVPRAGRWRELLNSDAGLYGGGGWGNFGGVQAMALAAHGQPWSLALTLPALSTVILEEEAADD
ncbi:MAG: alpha amylase C-terminal domain-containing protein, partial [Burkholderiaceae bacterium]|nr:alpha amylase C-terminal domain-containing protein [Burkholderiaceae bacterium]